MSTEKEIIEIPFGAKDSELVEATYFIPEDMGAVIDGNKVIIRKKESEDEKIKKEILEYFYQFENGELRGVDITSWIAWLEKQGEQKAVDSSQTCKMETLMTLDEAIEHCKKKSCDDTACGKEHKQLAEWLTELKGYRGSVAQEAQKPAWSEEDERNASYICAAINCYYILREERNNTNGQEDLNKARNWLYNKLKFLRPQSHWKPSDEQMRVLEKVVNGQVLFDNQYNSLKDLLEQVNSPPPKGRGFLPR